VLFLFKRSDDRDRTASTPSASMTEGHSRTTA